jgi:6-methylsalicylate decarboxylase
MPSELSFGPPHRIDVHHHIFPPKWFAQESDRVAKTAVDFSIVKDWTPDFSLEAMDATGVRTAVTSISTVTTRPGAPEESASLARDCNEYAARLSEDHPGRFGTFALLPLPHIDQCLSEIEYCSKVLGVDGFKLQTNYEDKWLGDRAFDPVYDELNRQQAVVFVHPTVARCCANLLPGISPPLMEFPFDTTRAIANLLFNGVFLRYPEIRFIFSHGGGTMPMLAHRIGHMASPRKELVAMMPHGIVTELRKLYFDMVTVTNRPALSAILNVTNVDRLLFGSDLPFMEIETTANELQDLGLSSSDVHAIERDNALALMPSLPTE